MFFNYLFNSKHVYIKIMMNNLHRCSYCEKTFARKDYLMKHLRILHKIETNKNRWIKCPTCREGFAVMDHLRKHIETEHQTVIEVEELTFKTLEDFYTWKESVEKAQHCSYILHKQPKRKNTSTLGIKVSHYICNRSGYFKSKGSGKRKVKGLGTRKIDGFCPAAINIAVKEIEVAVKFFKTHYGHDIKLEHLYLSKSERKQIADKLKKGISFQKILDNAHDSVDGSLERIHLLNRKDLHNIRKEFHISNKESLYENNRLSGKLLGDEIKSAEEHKDQYVEGPQAQAIDDNEISYAEELKEQVDILLPKDDIQHQILPKKDMIRIKKALSIKSKDLNLTDEESLGIWVKSCFQMENSPVLLYSSQSFDKNFKEGFTVIIMTEYQKHILLSSVKKTVCIDRFCWRNVPHYYVIILYVIDEYNIAFPSAYCISSEINKSTLIQFFDVIKQTTGCLETNHFMSDNEEFFFEAWTEVMNSNAKWLWNTWNINSHWKQKLLSLKGAIEKKAEISNKMSSLLKCKNKSVFTSMLESFIKSLTQNVEYQNFGTFFEQNYAPNAHMWALCYRVDFDVSINITFEILHHTFSFCATEEPKKKLDQYIFVFLKLVRDKILDRFSKIDVEKLQFALANIAWCHQAGLNVPAENIYHFSDKQWQVKCVISDETFHVMLDNESCPECCTLTCNDCNICIHMFTCTCCGNLINANLCEHIHAVAITSLTSDFATCPPLEMRNEINDVEIMGNNDPLKTSFAFLDRTLKKAYLLCEKLKSNKLNFPALQEIENHLSECINICDKKIPSSDSDDENPEFKDFSIDTAISRTSIKSSSANKICLPVNLSVTQPMKKLTKRKYTEKKSSNAKNEYLNCKTAEINKLKANISTIKSSKNSKRIVLSSDQLLNKNSSVDTPIKLLSVITTSEISKSVNTLTSVQSNAAGLSTNLNTVYAIAGTSNSSNNLNTVFAILTPVNSSGNVQMDPVTNPLSTILVPKTSAVMNTCVNTMSHVNTLTIPKSIAQVNSPILKAALSTKSAKEISTKVQTLKSVNTVSSKNSSLYRPTNEKRTARKTFSNKKKLIRKS